MRACSYEIPGLTNVVGMRRLTVVATQCRGRLPTLTYSIVRGIGLSLGSTLATFALEGSASWGRIHLPPPSQSTEIAPTEPLDDHEEQPGKQESADPANGCQHRPGLAPIGD